jgi:uncharacterized membrane protein
VCHHPFAISLLAFGVAHFLEGPHVASLVPAWIPLRLFWAYVTGMLFVAVGLSVVVGWFDTVAATLLGVMFLIWFAVVHLPHFLDPQHPYRVNEWSSMFIALGLCGASWIIATDTLKHSHQREA